MRTPTQPVKSPLAGRLRAAISRAYDRLVHNTYGPASRAIAPGLRNSHYYYAEALRRELPRAGRWLDLGCGHDFLPAFMTPAERALVLDHCTVVGIDLDARAIAGHPQLRHRVIGNGQELPFEDASFDLVSANMVIEHVSDPAHLFGEISRVLRPGGRVVLHTPNVRGYTTRLTTLLPERALAPLAGLLFRRKAADVYPTFYRANSVDAIASLAQASGLTVAASELVSSSPQTVRIPPLMALELLLIRWLRSPRLAGLRACLLATLQKPVDA
jgi:SAM-dependent methyltransferase